MPTATGALQNDKFMTKFDSRDGLKVTTTDQ